MCSTEMSAVAVSQLILTVFYCHIPLNMLNVIVLSAVYVYKSYPHNPVMHMCCNSTALAVIIL